MDFIKDCPVFLRGDPRFAYDLVLAVGKRNQLSDGVKYQILTSRDYLSDKFEFPQSLTTDFKKYRRCSVRLLSKFEFLCDSPTEDGVYCVNCILFSNSTEKRKLRLVQEREREREREREIGATRTAQAHYMHSLLNVKLGTKL